MKYLNSKEAAALLGMTPGALAVRRHRNALPIPYLRVGKGGIRYRLEDVERYIAEHTINPTNENSPQKSHPSEG